MGSLIYDFVPTHQKFLDHFNLIGMAPLLDPSIIDMSTRMPPSLKYNCITNTGKIPLRKILAIKKQKAFLKIRWASHSILRIFGLDGERK